ncbi:MAG: tandem-95 repeat protein, partial [Burkholderiaceae bacterium]|nr:tandem-95 repeat protein [Burkholderiaceae bacterium]
SLLANDLDIEGDALTLTAVGGATHGSVVLLEDGSIVFTPDADFHGTAGFDYTVTDSHGAASVARAVLEFTSVDDASLMQGEMADGQEDTPLLFEPGALLANDTDADGPLLLASVDDAVGGAVALQPDGSIIFTPTLNHNGAASFSYTVSDGQGGTGQAQVQLTIAPVNDLPQLQSESLATQENQPLTITTAQLLANDSDIDGPHAALQITAVGNALHGSVVLSGNQVTFTPEADWFGPAVFDYTVADADGGTATAAAQIDVRWTNRAPVSQADTLPTQTEDTDILVLAQALLANDSDPDISRGAADSLRIASVSAIAGQTHGSVNLTDQGHVLYSPIPNYAGPVSFSYVLRDEAGATSTASASFELANVNDAPTVIGDVISAKGQALVLIDPATLLANDSDVDSAYAPQDLRITAVGEAQHGMVELQQDGNILFTPDAPGVGQFSYTVTDASGATSTATAEVATRNLAPVALGETTTLQEDQVRIFSAAELLANDTDADNPHTDLRVSSVGDAVHGTVALDTQGRVVFTPEQNYHGPASFRYTVADGEGGSADATAQLTLSPVNDAPDAVGENFTLIEDQIASIDTPALLANDSDVDGPGPLWISSVYGATGGSVSLQGSQVIFSPTPNFNGWGGFSYTVSDDAGGASQAIASIYYTPVNDAPVVNNEVYSGTQDTTYTFTQAALLSNDTDAETPAHLSITNAFNAQHGAVSFSGGNVVFTPQSGYVGYASFQYTVADPQGAQATGTTTVNLAAVNHSPVATDDSFSGVEDIAMVISASQLLANDTDDGGAANLRVSWAGNAVNGTVVFGDGAVSFTPAHNFYGTASFLYEVRDAQGAATNATAYLQVASVNDAPVTAADTFNSTAGAPLLITASQLLANDWDLDGGALHLAGIGSASNGSLVWNVPNQSFWFTSYQAGSASFQYAAGDGQGAATLGYVTVNVAEAPYLPPDPGLPIVLDMDGDGIELIAAKDSPMLADVNGDGIKERMGWAAPDDAVLAYDANRDGYIDVMDEISFVKYLPGATTDMEGLTAFDTDGDG